MALRMLEICGIKKKNIVSTGEQRNAHQQRSLSMARRVAYRMARKPRINALHRRAHHNNALLIFALISVSA